MALVAAVRIFVPILSLIIGFDPKSATAMSKCKRRFILYYSFSQKSIFLNLFEAGAD